MQLNKMRTNGTKQLTFGAFYDACIVSMDEVLLNGAGRADQLLVA